MYDDLAVFINAISHHDRAEMVRSLTLKLQREHLVVGRHRSDGKTRRGRKDTHWSKHQHALKMEERIGQILFFLHCGTQPLDISESDWGLCLGLKENLRKKGEWY